MDDVAKAIVILFLIGLIGLIGILLLFAISVMIYVIVTDFKTDKIFPKVLVLFLIILFFVKICK